MFKKVEYRRLYEDVINQIEKIIESGNLSLGDKLPPERELSEKIGVSRGTLREAFRILERQGIIETRPGGGRSVKSFPKTSDRLRILSNLETAAMLDLLEAREIIESKIVELACERATQADFDAMESALAVMENEESRFLYYDQAFHLAIAEATNNIVFVNIVELNLDLLFKIRSKTTLSVSRTKEIIQEHRSIFEAIKKRDTERAREAMLKHLKNIRKALKQSGTF